MAEFSVWTDTTAAGSIRVRHRDPATGDHVTDYVIKKNEHVSVEGKLRTPQYMAKFYVDLVKQRHRQGTMGIATTTTHGEELEALQEEFLEAKKGLNRSWKTVSHLRDSINGLRRDNNISTLGQFFTVDFKQWVKNMRSIPSKKTGRPLAQTTVRNRIVDVNVFCTWLIEQGKIDKGPVPKKTAPPKVKGVPRFYTDEEWAFLEAAIIKIDHDAHVGIRLAHDFGLREVELVGDQSGRLGVLWEDIIWHRDGKADLFLRPEVTKGGTGSRKLRLSADFIKLIGPKKTGPLVPMTRGRFWSCFKRARRDSKINMKLTVHGQRHTFGKDFLQKTGATQAELRDLLGQADVETTEIYSQFEQTHLDNAMERLHGSRNVANA